MVERYIHVSMPDGRRLKFETLKAFNQFMAREEKAEAKKIKKLEKTLKKVEDNSVFKQIKEKKVKEKLNGE